MIFTRRMPSSVDVVPADSETNRLAVPVEIRGPLIEVPADPRELLARVLDIVQQCGSRLSAEEAAARVMEEVYTWRAIHPAGPVGAVES